MTHPKIVHMLAGALALSLAACDGNTTDTAQTTSSAQDRTNETLAQALSRDANFSTAANALETTGLIGVMDGDAAYTIFMPTNAAFDALGTEQAAIVSGPENGAITAALMRAHMVPGALDMQAIEQAIADGGGKQKSPVSVVVF